MKGVGREEKKRERGEQNATRVSCFHGGRKRKLNIQSCSSAVFFCAFRQDRNCLQNFHGNQKEKVEFSKVSPSVHRQFQ